MKNTVLTVVCFFLFTSLPAHAVDVTFLNPGKQGERFWDMVTETMKAASDDLSINLEVVYAQRNRVRMAELGQQITAREVPPDYLILVNEEQAAETIFLSTKGKKTKTIMLLNDFLPKQRESVGFPGPDNPNLLGAVIPDNRSAGRRMMQALHHCAKQRADTVPYHMLAIGGDQLTPASIDRNKGAFSVIQENNDIALDRFLYANWNQQEAEKLTGNYLKWATRNQIRPSAIWAANDPIALGAKNALEANGLKAGKDVCLVGLNWSSQGLEMVKNGEMLLTDGGHFLAGAWSMVVIHDYHRQNLSGSANAPGRIDFPMQSIDQHNIDEYMQYLSDENWGKIDFSGFTLGKDQNNSIYDFSLQNVFNHIQ